MQVIFFLSASRNVVWIWEQKVVKNTQFPETHDLLMVQALDM